jgi:dsRNA-specific ribonuclease
MIGESGWFTNKDAAKEDAAMQALAWIDTHYTQSLHSVAAGILSNSGVQIPPVPPPPPSEVQPLSNRQLLYERLQRYQLQSTFSVDCSGPQHAQSWKVSFFLGSTMIGESGWFMNKDAAKEDAAMQALAWIDTHYTQSLHSGAAIPLSNGEVQTPPTPSPPPSEDQPLSNRQLPHEKYEWKAAFNVECSGPEHAQLWKVFFSVGTTMVGESTWFKSKDAAKENAATQALSWLNTNGYH